MSILSADEMNDAQRSVVEASNIYLNVLGFPPEPGDIANWPEEIPQPKAG